MIPPESAFTSPDVLSSLEGTRPWVRFLSIVGFVLSALMIVGGLIAGALGLTASQPQAMVLLFLYPLMGVLYIYPSYCLMRYSRAIGRYLAVPEQTALEAALEAQRAFWKFAGILTAVWLALTLIGMVLGVLIVLVAGVAGLQV